MNPETGFVFDFFEIERVFQPVLAELDHGYLNDIAGLENPTAELIAHWIWQRIKPELSILTSFVCYETPHCWAEYDGSDGAAGSRGHRGRHRDGWRTGNRAARFALEVIAGVFQT